MHHFKVMHQTLLLPFTLQAQSPDVWRWQPDPNTGYSVRSAYQLLTSRDSFTLGEAEDLVSQTGSFEGLYLCMASPT
jgi:hypothetical protein